MQYSSVPVHKGGPVQVQYRYIKERQFDVYTRIRDWRLSPFPGRPSTPHTPRKPLVLVYSRWVLHILSVFTPPSTLQSRNLVRDLRSRGTERREVVGSDHVSVFRPKLTSETVPSACFVKTLFCRDNRESDHPFPLNFFFHCYISPNFIPLCR